MVNRKDLGDVVFMVEGKEFYASKAFLVGGLDYVENILCGGNFVENNAKEPIVMRDVTYEVFHCVRFIYTSDAVLTSSNVMDVFRAADMYAMRALCNLCCAKISSIVDQSNVFQCSVDIHNVASRTKKLKIR